VTARLKLKQLLRSKKLELARREGEGLPGIETIFLARFLGF
jgi:hypothetical protein